MADKQVEELAWEIVTCSIKPRIKTIHKSYQVTTYEVTASF